MGISFKLCRDGRISHQPSDPSSYFIAVGQQPYYCFNKFKPVRALVCFGGSCRCCFLPHAVWLLVILFSTEYVCLKPYKERNLRSFRRVARTQFLRPRRPMHTCSTGSQDHSNPLRAAAAQSRLPPCVVQRSRLEAFSGETHAVGINPVA